MSLHWPHLLLLLPVAPLARQDFRTREVSVVWLAVLGLICVAVGWCDAIDWGATDAGWRAASERVLCHTAVNGAMLLLFVATMVLWLRLRRKLCGTPFPETRRQPRREAFRPSFRTPLGEAFQTPPPKPLRTLFATSFGTGDVVMMAVVTPLFAPMAYVRFLLVSCIAALIWWVVRRPATIPLAGFMALTLGVYALCKTVGIWS